VVVDTALAPYHLKLPVFPTDADRKHFFRMNGAADLFAKCDKPDWNHARVTKHMYSREKTRYDCGYQIKEKDFADQDTSGR
jgi:hypothetical protein